MEKEEGEGKVQPRPSVLPRGPTSAPYQFHPFSFKTCALSTHGELFTVDHFLSLGMVEHFCLLQELALKHSLIHLSTTHHSMDLTICSVSTYIRTYVRACECSTGAMPRTIGKTLRGKVEHCV